MAQESEQITRRHPLYEARMAAWQRYRAFRGLVGESDGEKGNWLPQGSTELPADYNQRLALTHNLGWSRPALRRMVGTLTKKPASRTYESDDLAEWDRNVDGAGTDIDQWFRVASEEAFGQGYAVAEIAKPAEDGMAASAAQEGAPFILLWHVEHLINWELDEQGNLSWAMLEIHETRQPDAMSDRVQITRHRYYDREMGIEWHTISAEGSAGTGTGSATRRVREWNHNLGVVPVVIVPGLPGRTVMESESYIKDISLGDWRKLQLESDQSMSSYKHGAPQLAVMTKQELEELAIGESHFIKLNPNDNEDAKYLTVDTGGINSREAIIERTSRESLQAAGIDPSAAFAESPGDAQSGISIAYSFSTSEVPTLVALTDSLDRADTQIHEVVARYMSPTNAPATESVFEGTITRERRWDLLSDEELLLNGETAMRLVKSPALSKFIVEEMATRVPGNLSPEMLAEVQQDIEARYASGGFEPIEPGFMPPAPAEDDESEDEIPVDSENEDA